MAVDEKISQLPEALTLDGEDVVPIVQVSTGLNKKVKVSTLLQDVSFIKDIVFKYDVDTVLEIGKINWAAPTGNHTMSAPTADASNLGKIIIVNNRNNVTLTITGVTVAITLEGVNSIVGVVCVSNGSGYGWEVFSRYNIGDFDLISQTITNGVTTKAPSEDAVFDALALKAPIASPTFTGTVTTPDVIVSGATVNTIAHFDASKNIESLPLATYPSLTELSYVKGVTSAIQTQINARSTAYAIPNYYRVDLNLGDDLTGVPGREDKPYRLIQTVWDLITTSSTAQITIEIVGDFTFTTHALLTSVAKDNITFLFKGKIVYAIPAVTGSRPLFTFSQTNNNITFIIPNYTQTTQGGFIYAPTATVNGFRFIIDSMQLLMGVSTSTVNNWGFSIGSPTNEAYFQCDSLTISITGDGSGLKGYSFLMGIGKCNYKITTLKVTGTASVASTTPYIFSSIVKSLSIENLITDNSYTNLTQFSIGYVLQCDNVFVNNISVASDGATQKTSSFALFSISACKNLTIMSGSILNYGMITYSTTELENLNLGNLTINGVITDKTQLYSKNINLLGNITKTVASQSTYPMINLNNGAVINGNGFKITHADPTYIAIGCILRFYGNNASPKVSFINNLTIYNSNIATGSTQAFVPIMYANAETNTLRFRNLVVSANLDNNSHAETSFIRYSSTSTTYTCRIEGNVATNYVKNFTNLTNDADVDLINGYTL